MSLPRDRWRRSSSNEIPEPGQPKYSFRKVLSGFADKRNKDGFHAARSNGSWTMGLTRGQFMIGFFLKRLILKNKDLIFSEAQQFQGFLHLLFKQRNTNLKWTKAEKQQIKNYLKRLSLYVPILIIFVLPGGSLLLPVLTEILDRRKTRRAFPVFSEGSEKMEGSFLLAGNLSRKV